MMTKQERTDYAVRFSKTWPRGPEAWLWEEAFADLDAGRVGATWARLSKSGDNNVTIPRFYEIYNSLHTEDRSTRPNRNDCHNCDNTGWSTIWDKDADDNEYSPGVEPCHCPWGRDRETVHNDIRTRNTNELNRLFPTRHQEPTPRSNAA